MVNVVIMVHDVIAEKILTRFFSNIPGTKLIVVPYPTATTDSKNQENSLLLAVKDNNLHNINIDVVLVESNYGTHASESVNDSLLNFIMTHFTHAQIVAYSGTPASLAKVLDYNHERVWVMDKNNKPQEDLAQIYNSLPHLMANMSISSKVISTHKLKDWLRGATEIVAEKKDPPALLFSPAPVLKERPHTVESPGPKSAMPEKARGSPPNLF